MAQNINDGRDQRKASIPSRKSLGRLSNFLAIIAVYFNFLAPITHGFMSTADAGEIIEICTNGKIEKRSVAFSPSEGEDTKGHTKCNSCPLCQIGKTQLFAAPKMLAFEFQYLRAALITIGFVRAPSYLPFNKHDLAPRAPPVA